MAALCGSAHASCSRGLLPCHFPPKATGRRHGVQWHSYPSSWGNLTSLYYLGLSYNRLNDSLPSSWGNLRSLSSLDLSVNSLTGSLPSSWGNLRSLSSLDLSVNSLTGSLPSSWGNLTALYYLNLRDNRLNDSLPSSWGSLRLLSALYLTSNSLTGTLPSSWSVLWPWCSSCYDVSNNYLTGDIPSSWLWSNATIRGYYFTGNLLKVSNMTAVMETHRFDTSGMPRRPNRSASTSWETVSASTLLTMSMTQTTSKSIRLATSSRCLATTSQLKLLIAEIFITNSTMLSPSVNALSQSMTPSCGWSRSRSTTRSVVEVETHSMNVTVSASLSETVSWCITPVHPGIRLVSQLTMPSSSWTAQSNSDTGIVFDTSATNGYRLVEFNATSFTHTSESISIVFQKSLDGTPPSVANFDLILSAPYATYAAVSRGFTASATSSGLSVMLTIPKRDVLHVHFTFDSNAAATATYTQQTVSLTLPLRTFACFDTEVYLGALVSSLSVTVMFAPVLLVFPLHAVSTTAYASMIVTFAAGSPATAAVSSRISLLRGYVDCTYDATQDGGFSVTGFYYGPPAGQYLRGAVVGNLALLYGMCAALLFICHFLGCVVSCFRQFRVRDASRMIRDMIHVPSVFVVPVAQTLQPTVAASIQLLFARAGDANDDILVAAIGLAGVMLFVVYFSVALQQQPWSLVPRSAASLEKRLKAYGGVFFWLRGKDSRIRDALAKFLFTVFEAKEHWQLADRPEARRVKRRLLMLFEDTRRMWYPVLDLWLSVVLSAIAGVAPLSTKKVCFWQLILTSLLFAALFVVSIVVRPAMNYAGTSNLALMSGLNFISACALLINNMTPNITAVNVATGALMASGLVALVVSIPGLIRLCVRLYFSVLRVLSTFPPRPWVLKWMAHVGIGHATKDLVVRSIEEGWAAVEMDPGSNNIVTYVSIFMHIRQLLLDSVVDQVVASSQRSRFAFDRYEALIPFINGSQKKQIGGGVPAASSDDEDDAHWLEGFTSAFDVPHHEAMTSSDPLKSAKEQDIPTLAVASKSKTAAKRRGSQAHQVDHSRCDERNFFSSDDDDDL